MTISFAKALGIHADAMTLRAKRAEVLANNIANVDTPGYHARDLDFRAILRSQADLPPEMNITHDRHFKTGEPLGDDRKGLLYRNPLQATLDENTVEVDIEKAEFARNAMQHQASFTFLNGRFRGLSQAIRGQR